MSQENGYRDVLRDDESLRVFLEAMHDFDTAFCKVMAEGSDYTLKLEIHGASGRLVHCRVENNCFKRPRGSKVQESHRPRTARIQRIA